VASVDDHRERPRRERREEKHGEEYGEKEAGAFHGKPRERFWKSGADGEENLGKLIVDG
jgi:hypothetical protein